MKCLNFKIWVFSFQKSFAIIQTNITFEDFLFHLGKLKTREFFFSASNPKELFFDPPTQTPKPSSLFVKEDFFIDYEIISALLTLIFRT